LPGLEKYIDQYEKNNPNEKNPDRRYSYRQLFDVGSPVLLKTWEDFKAFYRPEIKYYAYKSK